jgi:hypothetical protein
MNEIPCVCGHSLAVHDNDPGIAGCTDKKDYLICWCLVYRKDNLRYLEQESMKSEVVKNASGD